MMAGHGLQAVGHAGSGRSRGAAAKGRGESWLGPTIRFLQRHGAYRVNDPTRRVGNKTLNSRGDMLLLSMRELRQDGFRIDDPAQLRTKHVAHLFRKWENRGLSASTLQNRATVLRWVAEISGKHGMVKSVQEYLADAGKARRQTSATRDRSWIAAGVDPMEMIGQIAAEYPREAMVLRAQHLFGLRLEEALCLKPVEAARAGKLYVVDGTKGGRQRVVDIESQQQAEFIDDAVAFVGGQPYPLGGPERSLAASKAKYYRVLRKFGISRAEFGVTGHGLRTQYANDRYQALAGALSPVRGGAPVDYAAEMRVRTLLTNELGHARLNITTAYTGSFARMRKTQQENVVAAMKILQPHLAWLRERARELGLMDLRLIGQRVLGQPAPDYAPVDLLARTRGDAVGLLQDTQIYALAVEASNRVGIDVLIKREETWDSLKLESWKGRSLPLFWPDDMVVAGDVTAPGGRPALGAPSATDESTETNA